MRGWSPGQLIGPVLLGLMLLGSPAPAQACSPGWPAPVSVERPTWPEEAKLQLVDERIEIECDDGPARGFEVKQACRWRAHYVYEGASGAAVDGQLLLPPDHELTGMRLRINGSEVPTEILARHEEEMYVGPYVELHAEDGRRVEVEVELELDVRTWGANRCSWEAGFVRHLLVARELRTVRFMVRGSKPPELPPLRTELEVRAPRGWRVIVHDDGPKSRRRELSTTIEARELSDVELENRPIAHGPFIAAGVGFGPQVRARLRAGYEVAAPPFLLYSLAVEGDAVEELMLIPAIEVASPSMIGVIPSAGIGIGAPVMLLPDVLAGVRTQLSLMWPVAGLIGSVDVYPRPGKPAVRGALMLQLSI